MLTGVSSGKYLHVRSMYYLCGQTGVFVHSWKSRLYNPRSKSRTSQDECSIIHSAFSSQCSTRLSLRPYGASIPRWRLAYTDTRPRDVSMTWPWNGMTVHVHENWPSNLASSEFEHVQIYSYSVAILLPWHEFLLCFFTLLRFQVRNIQHGG